MKHRKPQKVCLCGHARSMHGRCYTQGLNRTCCFCLTECKEFTMDNLRTLEKLSEFAEKKNI